MRKFTALIALALIFASSIGATGYFITRTNIAQVSVNLPFGFSARTITVRAPETNTADLCIDWEGLTAVCPAANTAGDDRLSPGETLELRLDPQTGAARSSVSVIAETGTQTFKWRAFR